jgi:hypothetical protein
MSIMFLDKNQSHFMSTEWPTLLSVLLMFLNFFLQNSIRDKQVSEQLVSYIEVVSDIGQYLRYNVAVYRGD